MFEAPERLHVKYEIFPPDARPDRDDRVQAASVKRWLLIVFDGRKFDRVLHRMGLRPSRKPGQYVGFYPLGAEPQLRQHVASLKSAGLHGIARKVAKREPTKTVPRKRQPAAPPSAEIISILTAAENRLAHDALKYARERRRQAEILAEREVAARAKQAIRRVKGEV